MFVAVDGSCAATPWWAGAPTAAAVVEDDDDVDDAYGVVERSSGGSGGGGSCERLEKWRDRLRVMGAAMAGGPKLMMRARVRGSLSTER
jgi:hypothetical protein